MADKEAARRTSEATVVSTTPDVCLTPMGSKDVPVPYSIVASFKNALKTVSSVLFKKDEAVHLDSRIPCVEGDEAGSSGGVTSGVHKGYCRPIEGSSTVKIKGALAVRHGDLAEMNCADPDSAGNTKGRVVTMTVASKAKVDADGSVTGEKLSLPPKDTEEGVMARMLLAESPAPGSASQSLLRKGMQAMKAVVSNRLALGAAQFMASGATGPNDIISAPGQWHGFSRGADGSVQISDAIEQRVQSMVDTANTGAPGPMYRHVSDALNVAREPATDPFGDGTTAGWRTTGHGSPGPNFEKIEDGEVGGNQFYRLKDGKDGKGDSAKKKTGAAGDGGGGGGAGTDGIAIK